MHHEVRHNRNIAAFLRGTIFVQKTFLLGVGDVSPEKS